MLVSIITPCYNSADCLPRLLDSVLAQTHPQVEMIAVDDGSTDSTAAVIDAYVERFRAKGYSLTRLSQPHGGQSAAMARALPLIKGDFLIWPDSDDFFAAPHALATMATTLASQPADVGMVRSWAHLVKAEPGLPVVYTFGPKAPQSEHLFDDALLHANGFYYCAGTYMLRPSYLRQALRGEIYTSPTAGQNYQLLLPMLYHYRCVTIPEVLFTIVKNPLSHSRHCRTYAQHRALTDSYLATVLHTLRNINGLTAKRLAHYERLTDIHFTRRRLLAAIVYCQAAEVTALGRHLASLRAHTPLTLLRLLAHRLGYYRHRFKHRPQT